MKRFEGKKLLLLGSNVGTLDILRYAKANGAFTIVADNLPVEKSFGKQHSDDHILISTADFIGLEEYIRENKVDGVFAGISEFNLLKAMELCQHFGFPFYCTREQWDLIEDKEHFRSLCHEFQVPCPETYFVGSVVSEDVLNSIRFPVIVKPVDSSASVGVAICRDLEALQNAIFEALHHSEKGRLIIEEYFEGEEFTAHYTIVDGKASLSCIDNRVPVAVHTGDVTTIPIARIYPSVFIDEYIEQVNDKMINLCESLKIDTGVLFVQGLYNCQSNAFSIFEAGLRCAGEAPYRIIEKVSGVSFMNNLVDFSLLGKVHEGAVKKTDPLMGGKSCCVISFVSRGGAVYRISGFEETRKNVPSIVDCECRYHEGDVTPSGNTLRQIMLRFVLVCNSDEQMIHDVEMINNGIQVLDDKGKDICCRFDVKTYMNDRKKKMKVS